MDSEVKAKPNHRKDKPWDHEGIDHWKIDPWTEDDSAKVKPFVEESSFATLFPKYREKYLQSVWDQVVQILSSHGVDATLDLVEGSMTVKTTRKTRDPFIILKSRDLIKLLARSVPLEKAKTILEDEVVCDVIKIRGLVRNKERFVKRRARLLGPNGNTLKALELLTDCYILVQGNTVSVLGTYKGLKEVRRVVEECMQNVHPIYNIKRLMLKQQLAKDPKLANENWDRFLPKFKKTTQSKKSKGPKEAPKERELFAPPPLPRKEDIAMLSGEAFFKDDRKERKRKEKKRERSEEQPMEEFNANSSDDEKREKKEKKAKKKNKDEDQKNTYKTHVEEEHGQDSRSASSIASKLMKGGNVEQDEPQKKKLKGEPEKAQIIEAKLERKKMEKKAKKAKKKKDKYKK